MNRIIFNLVNWNVNEKEKLENWLEANTNQGEDGKF